MQRSARRIFWGLGFGVLVGCGVGYVSSDAQDVASREAELSVMDCLGQHGFDAGFMGHDGGFGAFKDCSDHFGHHHCGQDDGGLWLSHDDDGGFPFGFGHHDGGWFGHHCDGGFGHGFGGDDDDGGGHGGFGGFGDGGHGDGDGGHHHP